MFWGFSEALDLYQEYLDAFKTELTIISPDCKEQTTGKEDGAAPADPCIDKPRNLNIFLFGGSDPRHVIKTMAKLYKHKFKDPNGNGDNAEYRTPTINFYIVEGCIEVYARYMALLGIALENPEAINMRNKVHLFMDVYGNSLLRPFSSQYLASKGRTLTQMVSDDIVMEKLAPMLDIQGLKYRELDGLENAFQFWLPKQTHVFDIKDLWTMRIKQALGTRYDYREGAFDWDLNMTLKERDAKQICSQEYRYWRETGIAFTFPEYEQCQPNKTFAVGLIRNGEKFLHRRFMGDTETGPFCAFGLKTTDEHMMHSAHGENDYRATDITERNLMEVFYELQQRQPYAHNKEHSHKFGATRLKMGELLTANESSSDGRLKEYDMPWINIEGIKVHFVSAEAIFLHQNPYERWNRFFDVVFVGHSFYSFVKAAFLEILKPNGLLIVETKLLTLARKEVVTEFDKAVRTFAKDNKLLGVLNYNALNTHYQVLKFKKIKGG